MKSPAAFFTDGQRLLQALVDLGTVDEDMLLRIIADSRHHAFVFLCRREATRRAFGDWSIIKRELGENNDAFAERVTA